MSTLKLCKNCAYFDSGWVGENPIGDELCRRPIKSLVYEKRRLNKNPENERLSGECGENANFFVEKKWLLS